jgi:hypothetical protein
MPTSQVHGKTKINKSFAEERNVEFCPALKLASVFAFGGDGAFAAAPGSLVVKRAEENGGEKAYPSMDELLSDYKDGSLHPGDLKKHAMITVMTDILDKLAAAIKADKTATQAAKSLKAVLKKKK